MHIGYNIFNGYLHIQKGVGPVPWALPITAKICYNPLQSTQVRQGWPSSGKLGQGWPRLGKLKQGWTSSCKLSKFGQGQASSGKVRASLN